MAEVVRLPRGEEPFVHLRAVADGFEARVMNIPRLRHVGQVFPDQLGAMKFAFAHAFANEVPIVWYPQDWTRAVQ